MINPANELDPIVTELLADIDPRLLESSEGRKALCEFSPLLFALVYFPATLTNEDGHVTLAEVHREWADLAKTWTLPVTRARQYRYAFLAPRQTGKSSIWFFIVPLWLAAYGYSKFIAAFASRDQQAVTHLENFKQALKNPANKAFRQDFPKLCASKKSTEGMYIAQSGFVFTAQGIDSQTLGLKIGDDRPDTILLDDIEPDESSYSPYLMEKRLKTLQDAVLPLNAMARVVLTGTTTMPGSITHQLVKYAKGYRTPELEWIELENFQVHHTRPIIQLPDGTEKSFWESNPLFRLEDMQKRRHTREFMKNFECDPMAVDSEYWRLDDFRYESFPCVKTILSIDGAVTTNKRSDFTGLAVVGYAPPTGDRPFGKCLVKYAVPVKLQGAELRNKVLSILEEFPEIGGVLVETNQGGVMWHEVLHNLPVPIRTVHNTEKKESRAGRVLNLYQANPHRVAHIAPLAALEEQMAAFPLAPNDDLVDAVGNAVLTFMRPVRKGRAGARVRTPN